MGQKVSPHGLRVGVINDWDSKWYADKKNFGALLKEDHEIRTYIKKTLFTAGISRVYIDRTEDKVKINIFTAKPGMIVGRGGENIAKLKTGLAKLTDKFIQLDISEVQNVDRDAHGAPKRPILILPLWRAMNGFRRQSPRAQKPLLRHVPGASVILKMRCRRTTKRWLFSTWWN